MNEELKEINSAIESLWSKLLWIVFEIEAMDTRFLELNVLSSHLSLDVLSDFQAKGLWPFLLTVTMPQKKNKTQKSDVASGEG